jgi:hypothetical protein
MEAHSATALTIFSLSSEELALESAATLTTEALTTAMEFCSAVALTILTPI